MLTVKCSAVAADSAVAKVARLVEQVSIHHDSNCLHLLSENSHSRGCDLGVACFPQVPLANIIRWIQMSSMTKCLAAETLLLHHMLQLCNVQVLGNSYQITFTNSSCAVWVF